MRKFGNKKAIVIGAGPAGLTAALEILRKSNIKPIVIEATDRIGGISTTVNFKGNRIDIGGHRFFSKSDTVMDWWQEIFPVEEDNVETKDNILLKRNRVSRIYYNKKFFNYPITLSSETLKNLGLTKSLKIILGYIKVRISPIKNERTLEDFFTNRFGTELYETFFKNYTTKVWGKKPKDLSADWGAQRVKGISITKVLSQALKNIFKKDASISQKGVETSLISQFLYPKYGPGQLWEYVAEKVKEMGGEVIMNSKVVGINIAGGKVASVEIQSKNGNKTTLSGKYFFSTMPLRDLISNIKPRPEKKMLKIGEGLEYRSFVTVGVLLKKIAGKSAKEMMKDTWVYIHEPDVGVGRIQFFNNWSPYLVKDKNTVWIGLEYFCDEGDSFWNKKDKDLVDQAVTELEKLGLAKKDDFIDGTIIRMPKTYPSYTGTYSKLNTIKKYTDKIENLFLIGRNGMHRYNNMDHSMLTAIEAVQNIIEGKVSKENIWKVNSEEEYHETRKN